MAKYRNKKVDVVIDVRSHLEYWFGHLPGAKCIPVGSIDRAMAEHPEITADSSILVYCASGARSASAASALRGMGYRRVVDGGGYADARRHFEAT
ncbi:MAG TPA: rhodanese-like domain-containing protein [Gemmatimonadaceae bacterium]|nr:rhodanese-like domain-containing protein [Gemmatimonadaceae bacterium]